MKNVTLPYFLQPRCSKKLVRVGRDGDGGYVVDERDIFKSQGLIGLGINDDWSFEAGFYKINNVPLFAFDASIGFRVFLKRALKAVFHPTNPSVLFRSVRAIAHYHSFFSGNKKHVKSFVGFNRPPLYLPLRDVFRMAVDGGVERVFLKIDIEGHEYRIFKDLIDCAENITGLVIELHDVDLHLDRIKEFVRKFPLSIVHVHANNFSPVDDRGIPTAIELTFSSSETSEERVVLPHRLDMPNDPRSEEYRITFE